MDEDMTMRRASDAAGRATAGRAASPGGAGDLLPHVRSWGAVARASHSECAKAADAAQELERRRNGSGE